MNKLSTWKNEFQSAFKNAAELYAYLDWPLSEELISVAKTYPVFIPINLAKKIKNSGMNSPLALEFMPNLSELNPLGSIDPIGDKVYHKAPQLIHRYHSRALFIPTSLCPVHCRYCFRKNELNSSDELFDADFNQTLSYLKSHPEISEIIFTGGDPLTLSNEKIKNYLFSFAEIPTIKDIRFHTRYPVILPSRLDLEFRTLMHEASKHFRTVSLSIHANHSSEFDEEVIKAIQSLHSLPIQLLSQTVLLKNVNDSEVELFSLFKLFLDLKIRPYYLHHPDQVKGGLHFYVPLKRGRELYAKLRHELPGWAIPQYVIDLPQGEGKISAFNPESFEFSGNFLTKEGLPLPYSESDS